MDMDQHPWGREGDQLVSVETEGSVYQCQR